MQIRRRSERALVSYDPRTATAASRPPVNGVAVVSLVLGILGLCAGLLAPVGAVLGHIGRSQIKRRNLRGMSIAISGIAVGWAVTALWLGAIALSPQGVLEIYQGYGDFFTSLVS